MHVIRTHQRARRLFWVVCLALVCAVSFSGCVLAPAIDSFRRAGVMEDDRRALLPKRVQRFYEALYWGKPTEALSFVTDEGREQVRRALKQRKEERVVESELADVRFQNEAYEAHVEVVIRYYKVPYYVVEERREKQLWKFGLADGWKLATSALPHEARSGSMQAASHRF